MALISLAIPAAWPAQASGTEAFKPKSIVVPQIATTIKLDGVIEADEWRDAVRITDFEQFSPG
ncbi:MAG: hypothetical protein KJS95_04770, partial [Gammaproteobacteria bacterium]|nr:hypothetical protein [Gammaproteobacteria bacterium]